MNVHLRHVGVAAIFGCWVASVSGALAAPMHIAPDYPYVLASVHWSDTNKSAPAVRFVMPSGNALGPDRLAEHRIKAVPQLSRPGMTTFYIGSANGSTLESGTWQVQSASAQDAPIAHVDVSAPTGGAGSLSRMFDDISSFVDAK